MSNRMVRDDLLTSERYWACSPEARNLYVSILLSADDCARYTASNFALRTKCMAGTVTAERIDKLLEELMDVDLVRIYEHEQARYLFVPRFRQRLRYTNSRYPEPPPQISDLAIEKTDSRQSQVRPKTAEVKRREVKRSKALEQTAFARFWAAYPKRKNKGQAEKAFASIGPDEQLLNLMLEAIERVKDTHEWTKEGRKYTPYPASWLNAKGWEDEIEPARDRLGLS